MFFGKTKQTKQSERIPPNQNVTTKFPVLHAGNVPYYEDMSKWNLQVYGLVDRPMLLSFEDIKAFPEAEVKNDIHCVTGWSVLIISGREYAPKTSLRKRACTKKRDSSFCTLKRAGRPTCRFLILRGKHPCWHMRITASR